MAQQEQWRNRIVGSGEEDPKKLLANPLNARLHPKAQHDALEGVLDSVGLVDRVMVNQRTGHIVDGHLRVALAIKRGQRTIPVDYVDLTEEEERIVLASHDWVTQMAVYDGQQINALMDQISTNDARVEQMLNELRAQHTLVFQGVKRPTKIKTDENVRVELALHPDQLDLLERAIERTGLPNRGEAVAEICRVYLDANG